MPAPKNRSGNPDHIHQGSALPARYLAHHRRYAPARCPALPFDSQRSCSGQPGNSVHPDSQAYYQ
ncbi:hypothetical protein EVA_10509 [gut metagenome]|uniref:Uncharacterized protein n=1 Tax=gut metagenome TaxID=749906 RepID=J9GNA9_9ZZZZ